MQFFIQVHTCYSANPIPARSPAEREGQTRKMGRVEGGREEMMARRRGRGMDGWRGGFTGELNGGRQKKSRILEVWIRGRCLFTRKGRERNGAITLHS